MKKIDMPDKLWASYKGIDSAGSVVAFDSRVLMGDGTDLSPYEYIRADIADIFIGEDEDEPLEDGQYRWVEIGNKWVLGKIKGLEEHSMYFYDTSGDKTPLVALGIIGPVIKPPKEFK